MALGFFFWFSVHMRALLGVMNITANILFFSVAMKYVYGQLLKACAISFVLSPLFVCPESTTHTRLVSIGVFILCEMWPVRRMPYRRSYMKGQREDRAPKQDLIPESA